MKERLRGYGFLLWSLVFDFFFCRVFCCGIIIARVLVFWCRLVDTFFLMGMGEEGNEDVYILVISMVRFYVS